MQNSKCRHNLLHQSASEFKPLPVSQLKQQICRETTEKTREAYTCIAVSHEALGEWKVSLVSGGIMSHSIQEGGVCKCWTLYCTGALGSGSHTFSILKWPIIYKWHFHSSLLLKRQIFLKHCALQFFTKNVPVTNLFMCFISVILSISPLSTCLPQVRC